MSADLELAWKLIPFELYNTVYMTLSALLVGLCFGFPIGTFLALSKKKGVKPLPFLHNLFQLIVNIGRSIPFAILIISLIPFTRWVMGTSLGTYAAIVPLSVAVIAPIARLVEGSFGNIEFGLMEAAKVMGLKPLQVARHVMFGESLPVLVQGITGITIQLIGYSAMAGMIGGGGLGRVAYQYGYNRFNVPIMLLTIATLVLLVQLVQWSGSRIHRAICQHRGIR